MATSTASNKITREEYFALEATAEVKHEYYQGEIFAMTGGTFNHSVIGVNTVSALNTRLRGKPCRPTNSDMCIETPDGLITYPDVAVFCGKPQLTDNQRALLNPIVIIEVLSPTTRRYDQSDKFLLYRTIPTFQDYLLVDSEKIHVQHYRKTEANEWVLHDYFNVQEIVTLGSIQEMLPLLELYEGVIF
jgi:Uma2 family endonuclease